MERPPVDDWKNSWAGLDAETIDARARILIEYVEHVGRDALRAAARRNGGEIVITEVHAKENNGREQFEVGSGGAGGHTRDAASSNEANS